MREEYIYCNDDFEQAISKGLEHCFGHELVEILSEKIIKELHFVNIFRFYNRNCAGCVSGNTECSFAYQRDEARDTWQKVFEGKLFDCPVRTNGTLVFDANKRDEGIKSMDISDRNKPPYPVIDVKSEVKPTGKG